MTTWALIPVKSFQLGKSRLSEVLDDKERMKLARSLFEHVLQTLLKAESIDHVAVVTEATDVIAVAEKHGARVIRQKAHGATLAEVVDTALAEAVDEGATRSLVCMSDLPELSTNDVDRICRALRDANVVLVPDLERQGTNLLAMNPADCLPSRFGNRDSFDRHRQAARDHGLHTHVYLTHGGSFDVDSPRDLKRLATRPPPPE